MPASHLDEARDYGFADQALALRERAGLTQGVGRAAGGERGHPGLGGRPLLSREPSISSELIALYLERGVLTAGREEEAGQPVGGGRAKAARRIVPFDPSWFASLSGAAVPTAPPPAGACRRCGTAGRLG